MAVNHPITVVRLVVLPLAMCMFFDSPPAAAQDKPWLNTRTKIELSAVAAAIAADCYSTASALSPTTHELNPIISPFARNNAALSGGCAIGFASVAASNKLLNHHTRVRSALNWSVTAIEVGVAIHNMRARK